MDALDLFCGAGGASVGLHNAGFNVHGADIIAQPEYPYPMLEADLSIPYQLDYVLEQADVQFIWASPPCQGYIPGRKSAQAKHPKLIEPIRKRLLKEGIPFVIENVPGAPLRKDLMLCGTMFNLPLFRHRIFECYGFKPRQPPHDHKGKTVKAGEIVYVYSGGRPGCYGDNEARAKVPIWSFAQKQAAMGITHIAQDLGLREAIPPAYAKYIAKEFIRSQP